MFDNFGVDRGKNKDPFGHRTIWVMIWESSWNDFKAGDFLGVGALRDHFRSCSLSSVTNQGCRRANRSRERCPFTLPRKKKSSDSCHEQSNSVKKECLKGMVDHMEV